MSQSKILIVDDEPNILQTVRAYLEREGYAVQSASDGAAALKLAYVFQPDLIVLDIMLPGIDGLEVLRQLRQTSDVYVLLLTARADETDKIVGLTVGADDYLTKPFSPRELVARIKAILRRGRGNEPGERVLIVSSLRIDPESRQVWKESQLIDLTTIEFDILHALARHPGRVLSREQLIEQVWGYDYYGDERVVDVHIGRLRKKLDDDAGKPETIVTVRGVGYRLEASTP
ncbi:MAG: response regulator transcription factor [Anaerolineae bacterium]|nr:response regulator transcription factor [Anaerolineae bacterium]MCB0248116.1 response regulator transcription factor [Anaerolineae bacterium]MCB9141207.1 response regulator transcription factor [Anaerolineales bacterium]MCO5246485.1 response regulator transcription factor [Anaerolineae bacterium]